MAVNVADDIQQEIKPEDLAEIVNGARQLMVLELEIAKMEEAVKKKKEEYDKLATETLPTLMVQKGAPTTIPLANGWQLKLEDVFRANIPAESTIERANDEDRPVLEARREAGFEWLRDNKASDVIKTEIKINLGKGNGKLVKAIKKAIKGILIDGKPVEVPLTQKESVHPSTLCSLLKEKVEKGVNVPVDTFALFKGQEAVIIPPKQPKKKKEK